MPEGGCDVSAPDASGLVPNVPAAVDMPAVDLAGKLPNMSSVEGGISEYVPSIYVSVTAPDCEGGGRRPFPPCRACCGRRRRLFSGAVDAAVGLSGDKPSAEEVDPSMPSVEVKKAEEEG